MIDMLSLPIAIMPILPEEHFKIMKFFSKTFKVDCDIIKRLNNILITISCRYPITINELDLHCTETAKLIVSLYDWHLMPPTVHKVLLHSSSISHKLTLPTRVYLGGCTGEFE